MKIEGKIILLMTFVALCFTKSCGEVATISPTKRSWHLRWVWPRGKNKQKRLTASTINSGIKDMDYAVRGQVVIAANRIEEELDSASAASSKPKYPFDHIIYTNIGNPHSVGQKPLTWPRQVMALVDLPDEVGIDHPLVQEMFPADAVARAREIKQQLEGFGTGAYSHSQGIKAFRNQVAEFITKRDGGLPSDPDNIFLTNGASDGIEIIIKALLAHDKCGILIPIPQYPLYSATIDLLHGKRVGYYLNEKAGWALDMKELERAYDEATAEGIEVRAIVVINPGNPSGSVLTRENLHSIVRFCVQKNLVLMADEVYQENVYNPDHEFTSCKRAAYEVGLLDDIELVSFHSTSKGVFGECGRRGGYMELVGFDEEVINLLYKLASAFLCSNLNGQVMVSLMVRGPSPGDVSYESHQQEMKEAWESLKRRGALVSQGLNQIPGFSCQPATGAMYCFPSVQMPPGATAKAAEENTTVDTLYALSLLKKTGICVVPASGFGQLEGRHGFRTTFLPSEDEMAGVVQKIQEHHEEFCKEYS